MLGFGALGEFSLGEFAFSNIVITEGGGSSAAIGESADRRKKRKTGFEPVKRFYIPQPAEVRKLPLPPFREPPQLAPSQSSPLDIVDPNLMPPDMLGLQSQILAAQEDYRRIQSEQDAADIADVLAILDRE